MVNILGAMAFFGDTLSNTTSNPEAWRCQGCKILCDTSTKSGQRPNRYSNNVESQRCFLRLARASRGWSAFTAGQAVKYLDYNNNALSMLASSLEE